MRRPKQGQPPQIVGDDGSGPADTICPQGTVCGHRPCAGRTDGKLAAKFASRVLTLREGEVAKCLLPQFMTT
jgi:hypothetical protein